MVDLFRSRFVPTNQDRVEESPQARLRALREEAERSEEEHRPMHDSATRRLPLPLSKVDIGRLGSLGLAVAGLVALIVISLGILADRPTAQPVARVPLPPPPVSNDPPASLVVSVVGRVTRPGLVTVRPGERVADVLLAAGGALPDTDLTMLNLARKVADGEQLYVGIPQPASLNGAFGSQPAADSRVDLNTATKEQLDALPGVGEVTAERIVQWRQEHGRFSSVEQLREVGGIGDTRFARLRDRVRV